MGTPLQLDDNAAARIDALAQEGITLTPAEIVELNGLCAGLRSPDRIALVRGRPIFVGGTSLWPLTLRAYAWLDEGGWKNGIYAIAWAMAHCYDEPSPFLQVDPRRAGKTIRQWMRTLACTPTALAAAVEAVGYEDAEDAPPDTRSDMQKEADSSRPAPLGAIVARLVATCGGTPEMWEAGVSCTYALRQLHTALAQSRADGISVADSPAIQWHRAIAACMWRIRERARLDKQAGGIENG